MIRKLLSRPMAGLMVGLLTAPLVQAAPQAEIQELKQTVQLLLQRIEQLENQQQELVVAQETIVEQVENSAASQLAQWAEKTTIGGYGEVHWNNTELKDEIDLHRFVLFFGHQFTDDLRFFSELEVEHSLAGEGKNGEVEVEQAYIEYDLNDQHRVKGGVFLLPVGILNETHEPDTFYGVERNNVEKNIIPTTWWEAGAMVSGELGGGLGYDVAVHSGLEASKKGAFTFKPRDGRRKVSEAPADDPAFTARLRYTGVPGLELAATVQHQADMTQSDSTTDEAEGLLLETHMVYQRGPIGFKALYAQWDIDGDEAKALGRDEQDGWFVEPSYRINPRWGVFARHSRWDNEAGAGGNSEFKQTDVGVNYWPHENVVLKFDLMDLDAPAGKPDDDGFNVGIGYQF
ncbi:MAG TPA: porin [Gammaproteobacteria bacterium]|nr:porin [Gammaproteobacteria bacterium]